MTDDLIQSKAAFGLHLEGSNEIDAELLSETIHDMAELTKLAASEENPQAYLKMNVTAFRNGSFQIDFSTICETVKTMFVPATAAAGFAASVVNTVKGFFEIKKLLKGEKPKNVSDIDNKKIVVENNVGEKITVNKYSQSVLNNCQIDQLTINISNCVMEHNPNGGFEFVSENGNSKFSAQNVQDIAKPIPIQEETICKRFCVETELPIVKAALVGRSAWSFIYNGKNIIASIDDEIWISEVNRGDISIRSGDYINATLEIYVDLDSDGKPIEKSEKYAVIKVHGGIRHRAEQTIL
jgi:hypothetical protein